MLTILLLMHGVCLAAVDTACRTEKRFSGQLQAVQKELQVAKDEQTEALGPRLLRWLNSNVFHLRRQLRTSVLVD